VSPHYGFPPARAYALNRLLFRLKSDDALRARYLTDPDTAIEEAGLDPEERAALTEPSGGCVAGGTRAARRPIEELDRDRLVALGAHPYLVFMAALRLRMERDPGTFERF
jgi:hypothetical protein